MLLRVYPYGAHYSQVKKPSKYLFTSSTYRAMYYNLIGSVELYDQYKGRLLEDVTGVGLSYLYSNIPGASLTYDNAESGADFILLPSVDSQKIILEVCMGKKGFRQAINSLQKVKAKYGLIVSQTRLDVNKNQKFITVPLEYFLLV